MTSDAYTRRLAEEQVSARLPSVTAGVCRDGDMLWCGTRGSVVPGDARAQPANIQYRIGSITKTFTAVLVARLRDEGRLDFADPLERHLPGTAIGDRTIGQLLSHTGGLQAEIDGEWWERVPGLSWAELAKTLSAQSLRHRAGSRFHYSNLGYAVLGELIARHRRMSWYDAVRTEILDPLELHRTSYAPEPPHVDGFAVHPWADLVQPEPAHDAAVGAPAGQLWSTVGDLRRWLAFIAGDGADVLHPDTIAELRQPNAVDDGTTWVAGYGLGFQVVKLDGRTLVGHGGSMPGFLAGVYVDVCDGPPGSHDGVIAFANSTTGLNPGALATDLLGILEHSQPRLPAPWEPVRELPAADLEILGPWYWGPAAYVLRALGDRTLHLGPVAGRGRSSTFRPDGVDRWIGQEGYYAGELLRVVRDAAGHVSHLDLATFVFTRAPYDPAAPVPGGVDPRGWRPHG